MKTSRIYRGRGIAPWLAVALCIGGSTLIHQPSTFFAQGILTPPGPPAPTMKTLSEVEPRTNLQATPAPPGVDITNANYHFIINQPGSYYLSANLSVTKANGIQINAEGVALDLNGFQIARASGATGNGIEIQRTSHRASVRNGSIKSFAYGIRSILSGDYARACAFRDLAVSGCTDTGILAGEGAVLESCRAHENSGTYGISAAVGSILVNCTATENTGLAGIHAAQGSSLANCAARRNTSSSGIFAETGSSLVNCSATGNIGTFGISAGIGSSLANCSAQNNTSPETVSAGIVANQGSTVTGCTSRSNLSTAGTLSPTTGMGFFLGAGSTVQNCTAHSNKGDGINVPNGCLVRENHCEFNGLFAPPAGDGAGIHATGSDNRIEANNVSNSDRGIDVDAGGNLIIKNSASSNGNNYDITGPQTIGPIITATGTITTTNPWANFEF